MAGSIGDTTLTVIVTAEDIAEHQNNNPYKTSLGVAVLRQIEVGTSKIAIVSLGTYSINIGGIIYNMDPLSIAFCNTEVAGVSVTIPYTATLTIATII